MPRRLFVFNGGFFQIRRVNRILDLAGWTPTLGLPGRGDAVGIWGGSPTSGRGKRVARWRNADVVHVEDAFLRSIQPGRDKSPIGRRGPIGLIVDPVGLHFDPNAPSLLETLIASPESIPLQGKAQAGIARLIDADLSKYNAHLADIPAPSPGYVLVIDQTRGDASLRGAGRTQFLAMLAAARAEYPGKRILIRAHPETAAGLRPGHFTRSDLASKDEFCDAPLSPWTLLAGADAVYVMSSQLGYEAMMAGHRPRIFGQPFYAGWGLSDDEHAFPRRSKVPLARLFAASHLLAPIWYDPCRDQLTDFDGAVDQIEAEAKAWRQDHQGHVAFGMRLWKRSAIAKTFGQAGGLRFAPTFSDKVTMAWANRVEGIDAPGLLRVEDGFLRSRGLGAELVPALSMVADDLGIYFDPTRPSRLEDLIARPKSEADRNRAKALICGLNRDRISKYNLSVTGPALPPRDGRRRILVPGQVEDDASIRLGAGAERSNLALLERVHAENPDAMVIYKPHPDVEAGLRPGIVAPDDLCRLADHVASFTSPTALLADIDEVWTITSTLGFEALLRGVKVTTLGAPFYAGWGLTHDLGPIPLRRTARPDVLSLAYAVLIAYPRYFDPKSGLPCPPEVVLDRLGDPHFQSGGPRIRLLAKAQGLLAGQSWLWRR